MAERHAPATSRIRRVLLVAHRPHALSCLPEISTTSEEGKQFLAAAAASLENFDEGRRMHLCRELLCKATVCIERYYALVRSH